MENDGKEKNILKRLEDAVTILLFTIMVAMSFLQVVNRNILHLPLSWLEESSRLAMVFMAMLGVEMGLRDGSQIAITGVVDRLRGRFRAAAVIIAKVIIIGFAAAMAISSIQLMQLQIVSGRTSAALHIPMAALYGGFAASFIIISIVQICILASYIKTWLMRGKGETV